MTRLFASISGALLLSAGIVGLLTRGGHAIPPRAVNPDIFYDWACLIFGAAALALGLGIFSKR